MSKIGLPSIISWQREQINEAVVISLTCFCL